MTGKSMEWQRAMRCKMAGLLCGKLLLLTLLWALFFSPSHRSAVDSAAAGDRFGVPIGRSGSSPGRIQIVIPTQPENTRD
jgi:hypothetical protein